MKQKENGKETKYYSNSDNILKFQDQPFLFYPKSFEDSNCNVTLSYDISDLIVTLKKKLTFLKTEFNLFVFFESVLRILYSKYADQDDLLIGLSPISGIESAKNIILLSNRIQQKEKFQEFYKKGKNEIQKLFDENKENNLNEILKIDLENNKSLYNLGFYYDKYCNKLTSLNKFNVLVELLTKGNDSFSIKITSKYDIEKEYINHFYGNLIFTTQQIANNSHVLVEDLNIIDPIEVDKLNKIGEPSYQYENVDNIISLFEKNILKAPHKISLVEGDKFITYEKLNEESNKVAHFLQKKDIKKNTVVAVLCGRTIEMIVNVLGVLKVGAVYLPIDLDNPSKRIYQILNESNAGFVLTDKKALTKLSYTQIKNLFDLNNFITKNESRDLCDFDTLPHIDRSLIDYNKYFNYIGLAMTKKAIALQATRGCPFKCAYCHRIWPNNFKFRSAENIYNEVYALYKQGVRQFSFIDDIFNFNKKVSSQFYHLVIKNKLDIQIFLTNGIRADILTKDMIDLMVEAGVVNIGLALETATPRLQKLLKKNLNLEKFKSNVDYICQKYPNVVLDLTSMIGIPTETEEEALDTLNFIKSFKWIHFPYPFVLKIHPNTEIGNIALENGVSFDSIIESMNQSYHEIPETLPFPKKFVQKYHAKFLNEYFLNKSRLLHVLPYQMKIATEEELVNKYNNYLPIDIQKFDDILEYAGILPSEISKSDLKKDEPIKITFKSTSNQYNIPKNKSNKIKILLIDLTDLFGWQKQRILHEEIVEPIGLMYLLTYLNEKFPDQVIGKISKSRIDFNDYPTLLKILDEFKPDVIGIRSLSVYKDFFHRTVSLIREKWKTIPIIAGGPYATIDYKLILQDNNIDLVVLNEGEITFSELIRNFLNNGNKLPDHSVLSSIKGIAYIKEKKPIQKPRDIFVIDDMERIINDYSNKNIDTKVNISDNAFLIYTSGSTGKPKGILQTHKCLKNVVKRQVQFGGGNDGMNILQYSSVGFDVFIAHELFYSLVSNGTLFITCKEHKENLNSLSQYIISRNIEWFIFPVSILKALVENVKNFRLYARGVKHIVSTGEQLNLNPILFDFFKTHNSIKLHNYYGPSETHNATNYTANFINKDFDFSLPIGSPSTNTWVYILNKQKQVLPFGTIGEIYIGGDGLAEGYLNNPEETNLNFIEIPGFSTKRFYRSGDIGRWNSENNLTFLGRQDDQIKINGIRIEISEIEKVLLAHPSVKNVVVSTYKQSESLILIVAYVIASNLNNDELRKYILDKLPLYMVPSQIIMLDKFPLNVNGKIDRKALPVPLGISDTTNIQLPRNKVEQEISDIWAETLEINRNNIDINKDFFELGGHSLKAIILIEKLSKQFNRKIKLQQIFRYPSIKEFSESITEMI